MSLAIFNSIWTLTFITSNLHVWILFILSLCCILDYLAIFSALCKIPLMFEFDQEILVHLYRPPGIFASLHIHWDGALLSLEEVTLEYKQLCWFPPPCRLVSKQTL